MGAVAFATGRRAVAPRPVSILRHRRLHRVSRMPREAVVVETWKVELMASAAPLGAPKLRVNYRQVRRFFATGARVERAIANVADRAAHPMARICAADRAHLARKNRLLSRRGRMTILTPTLRSVLVFSGKSGVGPCLGVTARPPLRIDIRVATAALRGRSDLTYGQRRRSVIEIVGWKLSCRHRRANEDPPHHSWVHDSSLVGNRALFLG